MDDSASPNPKSDLPPAFTSARASAGGVRNHRGFSYIALLAAVVIIGISLGAAGKYWSSVMLRDKEEELLFRGDQYRQAIERYYRAVPGRLEYPSSIDDLLTDNRTAAGKRHLRQRYKDPISGEDFVEVRHTLTKRIIGVHSPSEKQPLKQTGFPVLYDNKASLPQPGFPGTFNSFTEKSRYSEWIFASTVVTATPLQPAGFIPLTGFTPPPVSTP
jgi:type II secretory pathway pseudopilin PulG